MFLVIEQPWTNFFFVKYSLSVHMSFTSKRIDIVINALATTCIRVPAYNIILIVICKSQIIDLKHVIRKEFTCEPKNVRE